MSDRLPQDADDFTEEPYESDLLVGLPLRYTEEPGRQAGKVSPVTLEPCAVCGVPVITGMMDDGALIAVEPQTLMYALVWRSRERYPRLTPSRGYPAHQCGT